MLLGGGLVGKHLCMVQVPAHRGCPFLDTSPWCAWVLLRHITVLP